MLWIDRFGPGSVSGCGLNSESAGPFARFKGVSVAERVGVWLRSIPTVPARQAQKSTIICTRT